MPTKFFIALVLAYLAFMPVGQAKDCHDIGFATRTQKVTNKIADVGLSSLQYVLVKLPRFYAQLIPVYRDTFLNLKIVLKFERAMHGEGSWTRADTGELLRAIDDVRRLLFLRGFNWTVPGSTMLLPVITQSQFGKNWLIPRTMQGQSIHKGVDQFLNALNTKIEGYKSTSRLKEGELPDSNASREELLSAIDEVFATEYGADGSQPH